MKISVWTPLWVLFVLNLSNSADSLRFFGRLFAPMKSLIDVDSLLNGFGVFNKTVNSGRNISDSINIIERLFRKSRLMTLAYDVYRNKFNKSMLSKDELLKRTEIFRSHCKRIATNNLMAKYGMSPFELAINQFSDMFWSEVVKSAAGFFNIFTNGTHASSKEQEKEPPSGPPPESKSWQEHMSPVKNQGRDCGSCVMFSICGVLEAQYHRIHDKMLDLSEQGLLDCPTGPLVRRCAGTFFLPILDYAKEKGVTYEEDYPYEGIDGPCRMISKPTAVKPEKYWKLPSSEEALQRAIALEGPVLSGVYIDPDFMSYQKGIYTAPSCHASQPNHAVVIVGYGIDKNIPYWLVRNSWGPNWGESGYIRIERNAGNMCEIGTDAFAVHLS